MSAKLNILGGLPSEDEAHFSEFFGSETTAGLYNLSCMRLDPPYWDWTHRWKPKPEQRTPSTVRQTDLPFDTTGEWIP
jgi:hypothetical protein